MNKGTLRVLDTLSRFTQRPDWGVTELSRELKCSKNSVFQALDTLLRQGYVVRSAVGTRYGLGPKVLGFGLGAESTDIRALCRPYMERVQALTGESVFLAILVGRHCVCIDSIRGQGVTIGYSPLSQPVPLHAGSGPRLLLAHLNDAEIERYIAAESPLSGFTPTTITDPAALWDEVRLIRRQGFARGYEDFSTGANFLAFAVLGPMARPIGTIVVGGPPFRFTRAIADRFIVRIRALMDELNQHSRMFAGVPAVVI